MIPSGEYFKVSNQELLLLISSLELAARVMPEAEIHDPKLFSEKMLAVDALLRRLSRIAFDRGLRANRA